MERHEEPCLSIGTCQNRTRRWMLVKSRDVRGETYPDRGNAPTRAALVLVMEQQRVVGSQKK